MAEKKEGNFLLKIDKFNGSCHASRIFLKPKDIIVALDNQFYTFGEKQLTNDLKELKKNNSKAVLSILRDETFFNLTVENSLGCKFVTTSNEETLKIKSDYSLNEINDPDQLKEFVGLRDVYRNYDIIETSNSLSAGIFPPFWLAYFQKWWVLFLFTAVMAVSIAVNMYIFLLGWLFTSIYCYKAQLNLLYSFSMLEGKVFCFKLLAKSIDEAQLIVRKLDPKSKFKFSKLPKPLVEETKDKKSESEKKSNKNKENIVDENQTVIV